MHQQSLPIFSHHQSPAPENKNLLVVSKMCLFWTFHVNGLTLCGNLCLTSLFCFIFMIESTCVQNEKEESVTSTLDRVLSLRIPLSQPSSLRFLGAFICTQHVFKLMHGSKPMVDLWLLALQGICITVVPQRLGHNFFNLA